MLRPEEKEYRNRSTTERSLPAEKVTDAGLQAILDIPQISSLSDYFKQFIIDQNYKSYTPMDHAVWRYFMRQNINFLVKNAHEIYFEGLERTGLEIEQIPSIEGMNKILSKIGWAAVTVNGFIPPAAFMTFQAYRILVIAADMRQIEHIEYTPSPDIIHEAAGHAPVIADEEYAEYLRLFGEIGSKAMSSNADFELYEAIRLLSILKETPGTKQSIIDVAEQDVHYKQKHLGNPSEMALLSRLHWWTVEYGLIGTLEDCKIYGAGLLSSLGESSRCLTPAVKKLPYDLSTTDYAFDITTEQPQLFVTPDFRHLINVLKTFSDSMAYKVGGLAGLKKAVECQRTSTATYSSGLQVSGEFAEVLSGNDNNPIYLRTTGPTALAFDKAQLNDHGKDYHAKGFGSPIGSLKGTSKPIELLSDAELADSNISISNTVTLEFEGGVTVNGKLNNIVRRDELIILMTFSDCKVTLDDKILFEPSWGTYDMAVGAAIDSVFAGAADNDAFEQITMVSRMRTIKAKYTDQQLQLHKLYQQIRQYRESKATDETPIKVWKALVESHTDDWLLSLEILELLTQSGANEEIATQVRAKLEQRANDEKKYAKVITDGLKLVGWSPPDYS